MNPILSPFSDSRTIGVGDLRADVARMSNRDLVDQFAVIAMLPDDMAHDAAPMLAAMRTELLDRLGSLDQDLATMPYADYLRTHHWQRVREAAIDRARHRCQLCNYASQLQVHHRTYERRGSEREDDVIVLCKRCHETFHDVTPNGVFTYKRRDYGSVSS